MPKCDFNKFALPLYVNYLHIFRAALTKNTSERLLLQRQDS